MTEALVPNRLLFDFEFPMRRRAKTPSITGKLSDWTDEYLLPDWSEIDGQQPFARVWACWNENGVSVACHVTGRSKPLRCDPESFWRGDNLRLCTDMRDTRTIKRASRYCQQFYFLPTGGGANRRQPTAASAPINRAQEASPPVDPGEIQIASRILKTAYALEAHLPASTLSGFDPNEHRRIGFYYMLEDLELGQQFMTVGDDLYWHIDPSTWPTAVLVD